MQFRDLCDPKPQDFGLPCEEEAFKMVLNWSNPGAERHPAIAHAIRLLDFYNWKQLPTDKAKKEFSKVWARTVDYAMNGGKFDKLRPDGQGLTYYPPTKKQKADMSAKLKAIKHSLGS